MSSRVTAFDNEELESMKRQALREKKKREDTSSSGGLDVQHAGIPQRLYQQQLVFRDVLRVAEARKW